MAAPKLRSSSGLSLDAIVEFDWQVSLGEEPTYKDLLALARLKVPLVQVRGQWVEVNSQEILAAADFWKKNSKNAAQSGIFSVWPLAVRMPQGFAFRRLASAQALVISSYGLLQWDVAVPKDIAWGGVILDEAQHIKNPGTKQARAARAIPAAYRIALTGTPVENKVGDLWSLMDFLNPGFLGNQQEFRKRFFSPSRPDSIPKPSQG